MAASKSRYRNDVDTVIVKPIRFLDNYEEALGRISAVGIRDNFLIITMDSARIAVDFISTEELEKSTNLLGQHIGEEVAILRSDNPSRPLYIRFIKSRNQNM